MIITWMFACTLFAGFTALAALATEFILRSLGRQTRHVWLISLTTTVVWCVAAPLLLRTPNASVLAPTYVGSTITIAASSSAAPASVHLSFDQWVMVAWAALSSLLFVHMIFAARTLKRVRKAGVKQVVDGVPVLMTDIVGPAVIGGTRPTIVLPMWLMQLDPSLRALVLRHEQQHCVAKDPYALWASAIMTALIPWNAAVWFMASRLRLALEIDCDLRTLENDAEHDRYAKLLLLMAQRRSQLRFATMLVGTPSNLSRRISAMTNSPSRFRGSRMAIAVAVAVIAIAGACATRVASNITSPNVSPTMQMQAEQSTVSPKVVGGAPTGSPYFDFQVETAARITDASKAQLRRALVAAATGSVLTQFVVNQDGSVDISTFKVLQSNNSALATSVREALAHAQFEPAELKGSSVRQLIQLTIESDGKGGLGASLTLPRKSMQVAGVKTDSVYKGVLRKKDGFESRGGSLKDELNPKTTTGVPLVERGTVQPTAAPNRNEQPYFDFQVEKAVMATNGNPTPVYPPALLARNIEGTVLVQFVVNEDGVADMRTFKVLRSEYAEFAAAIEAVLPKMTFTAAEIGGRKVKQLVQQPFSFATNR